MYNFSLQYAAHQLAKDAKQWEENDMVKAAKKMAKLMMDMAKYTRGEDCDIKSKKDFIQTTRLIAKESEEVVKMAKKVADACTDKRMKRVCVCVCVCGWGGGCICIILCVFIYIYNVSICSLINN